MISTIVKGLFSAGEHFNALEVYPDLFQGSKISTQDDLDVVEKLGVKSVIDLEGGFDPPMDFLDTYLYWPFIDAPWLPNTDILLSVATFGAKELQLKKRVLVHCRCGLNRSGLVAGRIMNLMGLPGPAIIDRIRSQIPAALWNPVFREYIEDLV